MSILGAHRTFLLGGGLLLLMACGGGGSGTTSSGSNPQTSNVLAIAFQPEAQAVFSGQTATFTVAAAGQGGLIYQWYKNGTPISGATFASYTTPPASAIDDGTTFHVAVSNGTTTVTSPGARLTLLDGTAEPVANMGTARAQHTATLLVDGRVLVVGGLTTGGSPTATAELYTVTTGQFVSTNGVSTARRSHTATLLRSGKVLVAGGFDSSTSSIAGAEIYDPTSGTFAPGGTMGTPRCGHTATLLANGKVLIAGGIWNGYGIVETAELYDPATGIFSPTGSMHARRDGHTATRLLDGRVLVTGGGMASGSPGSVLPSAEIYDPSTGQFTLTPGSMSVGRTLHVAARLSDGRILVAGGESFDFSALVQAELFNPATGTFTPTGDLRAGRYTSGAVGLGGDMALVVGGSGSAVATELYSTSAAAFSSVGNTTNRNYPAVTPLANGRVLITGGIGSGGFTMSCEIYR